MKRFFTVPVHSTKEDVALLVLRVVAGIAFMMHGWGKIQHPTNWMGPDSPVPGVLQLLAAVSEFGGGLAWILGLLVPLASLGILFTMLVAAFTHAVVLKDPFVNLKGGGSYEIASIYLCVALLLILMGPGQFSADRKIFGARSA